MFDAGAVAIRRFSLCVCLGSYRLLGWILYRNGKYWLSYFLVRDVDFDLRRCLDYYLDSRGAAACLLRVIGLQYGILLGMTVGDKYEF